MRRSKRVSNIVSTEVPEVVDEKNMKEDKDDKPKQQTGYFELFRYASASDLCLLLVGTIAATLTGASVPIMFIIFGELANSFVAFGRYANCQNNYNVCNQAFGTNYSSQQDLQSAVVQAMGGPSLDYAISMYSIYFSLIAVAVWTFGALQVTCWLSQATRQAKEIRIKFFHSVLRQEIGFFDVTAAGELNTRMADDITRIQEGIGDKVSLSILYVSRAIAGLVISFLYSWQLALLIFAVAPLLILSSAMMFRISSKFTQKELDAYAKAGAIAEEVISSIQTVTAFGGQEKELKRYGDNLDKARKVGIKKGFINGLALGNIYFILFSTYGLAFWYGSTLISSGAIEAGSLLTAFFSVLLGAFALGQAASNLEDFASAKAAAARVFAIIDRVSTIDSLSDEGHKPEKITGKIMFQSVNFTYPARPNTKVLYEVNFTADRGKTTALVGQSGSGKSTCAKLIQRFYDPQEGTIKIDDHDIRTLNVRWLREHIGVVSQEPILFDTTIAENIRYGREGVTDHEIEEATIKSNAYDFIMKLPQKFETLVGEGGAHMSGGQKQRIAIARAIVRDPKVMLLDEATSALDTESEAVVQAALEKASQGRTTLVIAHRLSTIKHADKIIGFRDGKAVEEGSHDELMEIPNGVYKQLVLSQSYEDHKPATKKKKKTKFNRRSKKRQTLLIQPKPTGFFYRVGMFIRSVRNMDENFIKTGGSILSLYISDSRTERSHSFLSETSYDPVRESDADQIQPEHLPKYSFKALMKLNLPEIGYILVGCFASAINGGIQPAFAVIFSEFIRVFSDLRNTPEQRNQIGIFSLLFVLIGATAFLANTIQACSFSKSGEELTKRLRFRGFEAMLLQDISFFDDPLNSTGALTSRLSTDASRVQGATGVKIGQVIQGFMALGVALAIAFTYGWELTLLTITFVPFMILSGMLQFRIVSGQTSLMSKAFEAASKIALEATTNIRTIASLTKETLFEQKFIEAVEKTHEKAFRSCWVYGITFGFSQSVIIFAYAAAFRYGASLVVTGRMQVNDVFKVLLAVVFGASAAGQAIAFAPHYAEARVAAGRMLNLFSLKPKIGRDSEITSKLKSCNGEVKFDGVKFSYPHRPDLLVLKDLTLEIQPGKTLALVGQTGCGKSTCIKLLERFYDPDEGSVNLDTHRTRSLQISWLRSQLGLVSQEPTLFDCTIADNIKYGDNSRDVSMKEVIAAAEKSNIHKFITGLPEGYKTNVGAKGTRLSGGQKQRIAIARALIRNPKVLLLDEATSALDAESEKVVQEALDNASEGRTCIVVAHRLSTIKNADTIAVMEKGLVVEKGTHSELLEANGAYHRLVNAQLSKPKYQKSFLGF